MSNTDVIDRSQSDEQGHPLIWTITALLLLVLIAVGGYKYREHLRNSIVATATLDLDCLLNKRQCTTSLEDGSSMTIAISPQPIVAATPLQVTLQIEGLEAESVEIHFRGESMNMGLNQFILAEQPDGGYGGEVILPVCVRNSMMWIADVLVATPQGKLAFPFRFESLHP